MMKIKDVYSTGYAGNGIFTDLQAYNVPWRDEDINIQLDMLYYSRSNDKSISPFISNKLVNDVLSVQSRDDIANALVVLFGDKWQKLYSTIFLEYNPIENYRMEETENIDRDSTQTDTHTGTSANVLTGTTTDTGTLTDSGTTSVDNSIYGFNSSSSVPTDEAQGTDTNTETRNLSKQETGNNTRTDNLTDSMIGGENVERTLTRAGNIGITTSQQMIESERELWQWNYFNVVFNDIDSILCLAIYE